MHSGKTIRALRKLKGVSQQKVAMKLGITQQAYSKLETHEWIDNEKLENILTALESNGKELEAIKKIYSMEKK